MRSGSLEKRPSMIPAFSSVGINLIEARYIRPNNWAASIKSWSFVNASTDGPLSFEPKSLLRYSPTMASRKNSRFKKRDSGQQAPTTLLDMPSNKLPYGHISLNHSTARQTSGIFRREHTATCLEFKKGDSNWEPVHRIPRNSFCNVVTTFSDS